MDNPSTRPDPQQGDETVDVRQTAILALRCGICCMPPQEDGSKAPCGPWKEFQERRHTLEEIRLWYGTKGPPKRTGLGLICGAVSGNLEGFEFDALGVAYGQFKATASALGLGDLVERIEAGYLEQSPSGGIHWLYRCEVIAGNTPLARYASDELNTQGKPIIKPLIETKGEGGYIIVAPSSGNVHPTGKPYVLLRGGLETIATITPEERKALHDLARTFDQIHEEQPDRAEEKARKEYAGAVDGTISPIDDYNARAEWDGVLPTGWAQLYSRGDTKYWRRPGKSEGLSATINRNGSDRLYVFSTSTDFAALKPYSKFAAYALLNHHGDFSAAVRALSQDGYGTFATWVKRDGKWVLEIRQNPCPKGTMIAKPGEGPPDTSGIDALQKWKSKSMAERGTQEEADRAVTLRALSNDDLGIVRLADVKERPLRWLWKYRLSMGGLALMAGDGGMGKSQVLLAIGATVTTGGEWPDRAGNAPLGNVVIASAEDRPDDTIKPRLMALGADISRVTIVRAKFIIRRPGKEPVINLASFQDLDYWREVFRRIPDCRLFIADPIPSYLGRGVNDSKNMEIRQVLEPFLDEIIAPADICMLGNTHLNKTIDAKTPMHRISGSTAYGNLPRNVHFVVHDPDDDNGRRFFKQAKCNNAPPDLPAIAFRTEGREIKAEDGQVIETSVPVFEPETVKVDLGDLVSGKSARRGPRPEKANKIAEWLHGFLEEARRPVPLAAIFDAAGEKGFVGEKLPNGKWSIPAGLYRAKDAMPTLPEPRQGFQVMELSCPPFQGARSTIHWHLASVDAVF